MFSACWTHLSLEQPPPRGLSTLLSPSAATAAARGAVRLLRQRRLRVSAGVVAVAAGDSSPGRRTRAALHLKLSSPPGVRDSVGEKGVRASDFHVGPRANIIVAMLKLWRCVPRSGNKYAPRGVARMVTAFLASFSIGSGTSFRLGSPGKQAAALRRGKTKDRPLITVAGGRLMPLTGNWVLPLRAAREN